MTVTMAQYYFWVADPQTAAWRISQPQSGSGSGQPSVGASPSSLTTQRSQGSELWSGYDPGALSARGGGGLSSSPYSGVQLIDQLMVPPINIRRQRSASASIDSTGIYGQPGSGYAMVRQNQDRNQNLPTMGLSESWPRTPMFPQPDMQITPEMEVTTITSGYNPDPWFTATTSSSSPSPTPTRSYSLPAHIAERTSPGSSLSSAGSRTPTPYSPGTTTTSVSSLGSLPEAEQDLGATSDTDVADGPCGADGTHNLGCMCIVPSTRRDRWVE